MKIFENYSFKNKLTFGLPASADFFAEVKSVAQLQKAFKDFANIPHFILGGGSNVLFTKHFPGIVLQIANKGIQITKKNANSVNVKFNAGELWHNCVLTTLSNNWGGIENLSLIPGNVGAAPMQNIGAYGVELKDVFVALEAYNIETGTMQVFTKKDCAFAYRSSIFKTELKNKYIIWSVTLCLTTKNHAINASYGAIGEELSKTGISDPTIQDISTAVIKIRNSKLPDPAKIGNAGSFFKNPIIEKGHFEALKKEFTTLPSYPVDEKHVKVPAGWLIEQAGWKGYREKDFGVHKKQALVLVNYNNASGSEIYALSKRIAKSIHQKFDIQLQREVNVY